MTDDQIRLAILNKVSPSNIGDYAQCPLKLVLDATRGEVRNPEIQPYADFGTVAHWFTQQNLINKGMAVCQSGVLEPPTVEQIRSAMRCRGIASSTDAQFIQWMGRVADTAMQTLTTISPLPAGLNWVVEKKSYNPAILPDRTGRKGTTKVGFGGRIDLLRSDRQILWDLKFSGVNKVPPTAETKTIKGDGGLSNTYLWQLASYHISEGIPQTGLLWTARNWEALAYLLIDWTHPRAADFIPRVTGFLSFIGYKEFKNLAWPVRGPTCDNCSHSGESGACPLWCVRRASDPANIAARNQMNALLDGLLESGAATTGAVDLF